MCDFQSQHCGGFAQSAPSEKPPGRHGVCKVKTSRLHFGGRSAGTPPPARHMSWFAKPRECLGKAGEGRGRGPVKHLCTRV